MVIFYSYVKLPEGNSPQEVLVHSIRTLCLCNPLQWETVVHRGKTKRVWPPRLAGPSHIDSKEYLLLVFYGFV